MVKLVLSTCPLTLLVLASWGCNPAAETAPDQAKSNSHHATQVSAHGMTFVDGFEAGQRAALATGKPLVLFFTADWCGFCHEMAREALQDARVVAMSRQFVCVRVDADAEPQVCQRFNIPGMPTMLFVGADGRALTPTGLIGKQPAEVVVAHMQAALQTMAYRPAGQVWR